MILFSSAIGLAIEAWKVRKAVAVKLVWPGSGTGAGAGAPRGLLGALRARLPHLDLQDRDERYSASKTAEYDDIAIRHMLLVAYPLLAGYATYSLLYERHRSWYSWVINSLTGYIYAFGFVQMTPQVGGVLCAWAGARRAQSQSSSCLAGAGSRVWRGPRERATAAPHTRPSPAHAPLLMTSHRRRSCTSITG